MMWKPQAIALLLLGACDGGDTGSSPDPTYAPLSVASAAGKTYVPAGPAMIKGDGYDPVVDATATIEVISAKQIRVDGVLLTADVGTSTFRSDDGKTVVMLDSAIDGVTTDQMLFALASQQVGGETYLSTYVMGNATAVGDIPITAKPAVYTGKMTVFDDNGLQQTMDGPVLIVSLATADLTGTLTFANHVAVLESTKITDGSFYTTMASTETDPVVTGAIDGSFFGAEAEEIGGTVGIQVNDSGTPTSSYIGYYGTTTTP